MRVEAMMRVGIAYSSKDRVDKTKRTLKPLLQPKLFDTWWYDGSQNKEGQAFHEAKCGSVYSATRLTGGSCRYIVCALTQLLECGREEGRPYDFLGLVENDVMLHEGWFERTIGLFETGKKYGLEVGAVSARCYVDRILIQCDGFAIMHNLGAGMVIFSRHAAELILNYYRTGMTTENRKVFSLLSGVDIGPYWAFKGSDHMLVADWSWDRMLAQHGLCSLALTPTKATQLEKIKDQGLVLAKKPVKELDNPKALVRYSTSLFRIREGHEEFPITPGMRLFHGDTWTIFPHQLPTLGAVYSGDWRLKWSLGYGCFAWKAGPGESVDETAVPVKWDNPPMVNIPIIGSIDVLVSGGENGGQVRVEDEHSGFFCEPMLQPESQVGTLAISVPGSYTYRNIRVIALTPGIVFYGIRSKEAQPYLPHVKFDFHLLPPL
jgi:hypothetical protein